MAVTKSGSIDEYILRFSKEVQEPLRQIRQAIREVAPEAEETISYDMPTFNIDGSYLIYFAAWKKHIAIYPVTGALAETLKDDLAGYKGSKGSIHFPFTKPMPIELVKKITALRLAERRSES